MSSIIAISSAVLTECVQAGLDNARCIYNGIRLTDFRPNPVSKPVDILTLISVGRLSLEIKGHGILLSALALCKSRNTNLRLIFVGDEAGNEPGAKRKLQDIAEKLNISSCVEFLGKRNDINSLLKCANIFVMPSFYEGFGIALIEAMAAGLPVIASDIDGPKEILRNGEDGILVPPGDEAALAEAILKFSSDLPFRTEMAARAIRRASDFSLTAMANQYESLYRNVALE